MGSLVECRESVEVNGQLADGRHLSYGGEGGSLWARGKEEGALGAISEVAPRACYARLFF